MFQRKFTYKAKWLLYLGAITLATFSCNDRKTNENASEFNRRAMLQHYVDEIIIPNWSTLQTRWDVFTNALEQLMQERNMTNLSACHNAFEEVYVQWQYCQALNFGPGETATGTISQELNTYPARTTLIDNKIAALDTNFRNFQRDTRGFPALDYLLYYPVGDDGAVLEKFSDDKFRAYLQAVVRHISRNITINLQGWQNIRATFAENDSKAAGSSLSELYNEMVKSYEELKNFKIGLVIGRRSGQTNPEPAKAEGFYGGYTAKLALHHARAIRQLWEGASSNRDKKLGFKAYLENTSGGSQLIQETLQGFNAIENQLLALQNVRIEQSVISNIDTWNGLYTETMRFTRFIKSELSALLQLSITYSSGDGD